MLLQLSVLALLQATTLGIHHGPTVERNSAFYGKVTDVARNPVASTVLIYSRNVLDGERVTAGACSTETSADGTYRCGHLAAGDYSISIKPHPAAAKSVQRTAFPETFFPSASSLEEAEIEHLKAGQESPVFVVLRSSATHSIHAVLPDEASTASIQVLVGTGPIALRLDAPVTHYDPARSLITVDNLPDGVYTVVADWNAGGAMHHATGVSTLAKGDADIRLQYDERFPLEGTVDVAESCQRCVPRSVQLVRTDGDRMWSMRESVDDKGNFSFPAIGAGCYTLNVVDPMNLAVTALSIGSQPLPSRRFCADGQNPLGKLIAEVDGSQTVIDGKVDEATGETPIKTVVLEDPSTGRLDVIPLQDGRFHLTGLAPGLYRLYAWHDASEAEFRNHAFLTHMAAKGTEVDLDSSTATQSNVVVQPLN